MDLTTVTYETCAHCWHFIEPNDAEPGRLFPVAEFVHLDDGEKEHDHDAAPSGNRRMLGRWKATYPELFITYQDGKTGPNSAHFVRPAGNLPARSTVPRDVAHAGRPDGTQGRRPGSADGWCPADESPWRSDSVRCHDCPRSPRWPRPGG